jgi:hypothetical protein
MQPTQQKTWAENAPTPGQIKAFFDLIPTGENPNGTNTFSRLQKYVRGTPFTTNSPLSPLKLFVLHYSPPDAYDFVFAKDEEDLFGECSYLIDDDEVSNMISSIPKEKRDDDATQTRAWAKMRRELIANGSVHVSWDFHSEGQYSGNISWESYDVTEEQISFLRSIGFSKTK